MNSSSTVLFSTSRFRCKSASLLLAMLVQSLILNTAGAATIYANEPHRNLIDKVINAAARASWSPAELTTAAISLASDPKAYRFDPAPLSCRMLYWKSTANPKAIIDQSQNGDFSGLKTAEVVFTGVQRTDNPIKCEFDEVRFVAKHNNEPTGEAATTDTGSNSAGENIERLEVDVRVARYAPTFQDMAGVQRQSGMLLTFTIESRANLIVRKLIGKCHTYAPKESAQSLDRATVTQLRGKFVLLDVTISDGVCYYGSLTKG